MKNVWTRWRAAHPSAEQRLEADCRQALEARAATCSRRAARLASRRSLCISATSKWSVYAVVVDRGYDALVESQQDDIRALVPLSLASRAQVLAHMDQLFVRSVGSETLVHAERDATTQDIVRLDYMTSCGKAAMLGSITKSLFDDNDDSSTRASVRKSIGSSGRSD